MSQANKRPYAPQQRGGQRPSRPYSPYPQRGRPAPRRSAPPQKHAGRALPYGFGKLAIIVLVIVAAGFGLQKAWPNGFPLVKKANSTVKKATTITEIHSGGPLRINEIMSSNRDTLSIADGSSPDWVEIINVSDRSVDLAGYQLAESAGSALVFTFPEMWLEPDECVLVYCDSRLREEAGQELHAPFKLSSSGGTLMLFNAADTAVDTVNIPALGRDCAYARVSTSAWEESILPTPGLPNSEENYRALNEAASDSPVIVNEIMSRNRSTLEDENGQFYDYIELYNRSGETVELGGWYLSDDSANARKWRFPEVSIAPGEYLVVYASKLDRSDDPDHLHTNFALSSEGEEVVLANASGRVMDSVEFGLLKADVAYARQADGSWTQSSGTPGRAN